MSNFTRGVMVVCGVASSFALSAHLVLLAKNAEGYIHDEAFIFIIAGLPVGGWCGAFVAWAKCRMVLRNVDDNAPISSVGSIGCLGTIGGWILSVAFMNLIGVKGD